MWQSSFLFITTIVMFEKTLPQVKHQSGAIDSFTISSFNHFYPFLSHWWWHYEEALYFDHRWCCKEQKLIGIWNVAIKRCKNLKCLNCGTAMKQLWWWRGHNKILCKFKVRLTQKWFIISYLDMTMMLQQETKPKLTSQSGVLVFEGYRWFPLLNPTQIHK